MTPHLFSLLFNSTMILPDPWSPTYSNSLMHPCFGMAIWNLMMTLREGLIPIPTLVSVVYALESIIQLAWWLSPSLLVEHFLDWIGVESQLDARIKRHDKGNHAPPSLNGGGHKLEVRRSPVGVHVSTTTSRAAPWPPAIPGILQVFQVFSTTEVFSSFSSSSHLLLVCTVVSSYSLSCKWFLIFPFWLALSQNCYF